MTAELGRAGQLGSQADLAAVARTIRRQVVRLVASRGQGYLQQGLAAADIFTVLYFDEMRISSAEDSQRDRCFLSTAHNSAVFYATLAQRGLIPMQLLDTYGDDGSALEINVSERVGPAVEGTFGSLGQGLSVALGHALHAMRHGDSFRNYVILGDGELDEGQTWEAVLYAGHAGTDNLVCIIDRNRMQVDGDTDDVIRTDPIADKWRAFGWHAIEVDGNSICALQAALAEARVTSAAPTVIIANTVPGAGVSFLRGVNSHNMRIPRDAACAALAELEG